MIKCVFEKDAQEKIEVNLKETYDKCKSTFYNQLEFFLKSYNDIKKTFPQCM